MKCNLSCFVKSFFQTPVMISSGCLQIKTLGSHSSWKPVFTRFSKGKELIKKVLQEEQKCILSAGVKLFSL